MAIITPLKKVFNWQLWHDKITPQTGGGVPYKVYSAYVTTDDNGDLYALEVLENTIGAVTFATPSSSIYQIILPVEVPRLKIVIPNSGDYWNQSNAIVSSANTDYRMLIYPGYGIAPANICPNQNCDTNYIEMLFYSTAGPQITWKQFFGCNPTGPCTAYPIEIRVYN